VGGVRAGARLLPGARARAGRGALLRARAGAGDGRRDLPARSRARCASAGRPDQALAHPGRARAAAGADARRAHRGGVAGGRLLRAAGGGDDRLRSRCGRRRGAGGEPEGVSAAAAQAAAPAAVAQAAAPAAHGGSEPLLKMSELAERSGVSAGTIRHYLREGLLGGGEDIVRTSRNMAYYPAYYVQRIEL